MRIERRYTTTGQSPYAEIPFRLAVSEIRNPDGSIVFRQDGIDVPAEWSQVATDVLAQKYFRKAGVPARLKKVEENAVPSFLWRAEADAKAGAFLNYTDAQSIPWELRGYVQVAVSRGLISSAMQFNPSGAFTRAELARGVATILRLNTE